jgi:hypothetical protein
MPPFQYAPFDPSSYSGSIGELLLRQGDVEARRVAAVADAQARAAQATGSAYGGAIQAIGQIPQQIAQQRDAEQTRKMRALELQKAEAGQKVGALLTKYTTTTPDGHLLYDVDGFRQAAAADPGVAPWAHEPLDAMTKANDAYQQFREGRFATKQQALQGIYAKAAEAGGQPDDLTVIAAPFLSSKVLDQTDIAPMLSRLSSIPPADNKSRVMILNAAGGVKPIYQVVPEGSTFIEVTPGLSPQAVHGVGQPKPPTAESAKIDAYIGSLKKPAGTKWDDLSADEKAGFNEYSQGPVSLEQKPVLLDGKPATVIFNPRTGRSTDASGADVTARVKPIPSAAQVSVNAGSLSEAALDQAADQYLESGKLPPGNGVAGGIQRTAIMNRAAQKDPKAALARNQAVYKAESANLTNLQKTEGTLSAFETTAGKNLDQFLTLADKIPDTGVPWLNTPVRLLSRQIVGDANMAAIDAARDVALREIARVTNDPKLSGALTDSARAEVLGLSPQNATLPQIKAVAKVLKQDMANVHSGLRDQIDAVRSGLGGMPSGSGAAPLQQPIPGVPGGVAESTDGGKTWKRVK